MLTAEQEQIVTVAESSHNMLVTGQAWTGKSFLVKTMVDGSPSREGMSQLFVRVVLPVLCTLAFTLPVLCPRTMGSLRQNYRGI
jgi:sigma54-dependent transcription regulator